MTRRVGPWVSGIGTLVVLLTLLAPAQQGWFILGISLNLLGVAIALGEVGMVVATGLRNEGAPTSAADPAQRP